MPADAAVSAAVRSLTVAERSERACSNSVLAAARLATSACDFARSPRATNQQTANNTALEAAAEIPATHGHRGRGGRGGAGGNSKVGVGIESRRSLTMREAKLSRLATMKRRTSTACSFTADSSRRPQSDPAAALAVAGAL